MFTDDRYRPRAFFDGTRKEKMDTFRVSYAAGVRVFKDIHWNVERRAMVLVASGVAKHLELYIKIRDAGKGFVNVAFFAKAAGYGPYRTEYRLGSAFAQKDEALDMEALLQGFNDNMRRRTGLCFGKSASKPKIV